MTEVADRTPREWLNYWLSLDDSDLLDWKWDLYDRLELVDAGSELHVFARDALHTVATIERLRESARHAALDGQVFTHALVELARADRDLSLRQDASEIFAGAIEVAERRGKQLRSEQNNEQK